MGGPDLVALIRAIGTGDRSTAAQLITADPSLARARLARSDEFFVEECRQQFYAGDTALHAAACAYDVEIAATLVNHGADIDARNRRGAQPIHTATTGGPGPDDWDPVRQREVIAVLVALGADPNARASGGVTPLHRAVRNRCSGAVDALLNAGADPTLANDRGSTALDLASWTTGRGGTGSPEAKVEQQAIVARLSEESSPPRGS